MHPHKMDHESHKEGRLARLGVKEVKHEIENAVKKGVHAHESADHKGTKHTVIKFRASGGAVDGAMSAPRLDKASRSKGKSPMTVNVIVGAGQKPPMPIPVPVPPPPGPMAGPMAGAPMPPPGVVPPGLPMRKRGGSVMDAGAGSGPGREEKAKMNAKSARTIAPQNRKRGGKV